MRVAGWGTPGLAAEASGASPGASTNVEADTKPPPKPNILYRTVPPSAALAGAAAAAAVDEPAAAGAPGTPTPRELPPGTYHGCFAYKVKQRSQPGLADIARRLHDEAHHRRGVTRALIFVSKIAPNIYVSKYTFSALTCIIT